MPNKYAGLIIKGPSKAGTYEEDHEYIGGYEGWEPRQNDVDEIPNYEKLTRAERWIMDRLPGFADTKVGQALVKFNDTWAGKALQKLDILAEGAERAFGLGAQYLDAMGDDEKMTELKTNLSAAWQAGSLTSDFTRIPELRFSDEGIKFSVSEDLPGMAGIIEARRRIIRGESLEDVRGSMLDDLGALALRAQIQDAFQHIVADPLFLVGKYVKPVEWFAKASIRASTQVGLADQVEALSRGATRLSELANKIDDVADLAKLEKAAKKAGDVAQLEDIAKLNNILADIGKGAKKEELIEEVAKVVARYETMKKMSWWEQKILQLSGNMSDFDKPWEELSTFQKMLRRFNPLALTPQARAHELFTNVINHFSAYVLGKLDNPYQAVRTLRRVVDGTAGAELGHIVATPTGRIFQGLMKKVVADAEATLEAWGKLDFERNMLNILEETLKDTAASIYKQLNNGEAAQIYSRLIDAANPEQIARIEQLLGLNGFGGLSPEVLETITKTLGQGVDLYTPEHFMGNMLNLMHDELFQYGVLQFGVRQQGMIQRVADAVKAAESLAFLRLNPAYPIKNLVNNVATSIARGNFGIVSLETVEKFWDDVLGFIPARAGEAFTPAELTQQTLKASGAAQEALRKGQDMLNDVVRGNRGWLEKVTNSIRNFSVSDLVGAEKKWDFGIWAQQIERGSSQRAYYLGYVRGHKSLWKEGKGYSRISEFSRELADELGEEVARVAESLVGSSWNEAQIAEKFFEGDNLALNINNIVRRTEERLGVELDGVLGSDFIASIQDDLIAAAKKGESSLNDFMRQTSQKMEKHIDDWIEEAVESMIEEAAARVDTEGPAGLVAIFTDISDDVFATSAKHALDTSAIASDIRKGTDPSIANIRWRKLFENGDKYWDKFWNRQDRLIKSIVKRAEAGGFGDIGRQVQVGFRDIRGTWKKFYTKRKKLWSEFGDARAAGKQYRLSPADIRAELKADYQNALELEDRLNRTMDDFLATFLPEEQQSLFISARSGIHDLRRADREYVLDFRDRLPNIPDIEVEAIYQEFWQRRMRNYAELWQEEQKALAAIGGNRDAQAMIRMPVEIDLSKRREDLQALIDTLPEGELKNRMLLNLQKLSGEGEAVPRIVEEVPEVIRRLWLDDFHSIVKRELPAGVVMNELYYTRAMPALDALKESALEIAREKPLKWVDLPESAQKGLRNYISHVQGQMSDVRLANMKFGEYVRDSALLNYSRRTNLDNWLQTVVPYEFWTMHTAWKWALHTIDRPHVTANILRLKKFIDTGFRPESGFPTRLKGHIRIKLPFLTKLFGDWMGDELFINPMSVAVPMENFTRPYEEYLSQERRDEGMAERVLEELLNDGQISQEDYINAVQSHAGPAWERAVGLARQDDTEGRLNALDLGTMLLSPHAPLMWAYNASKGEPAQEGAFTPLGRSIRGIAGLFGVDSNDIPVLGIAGKIRQSLGLHPFSEWDDYRNNRMMVNMLAAGETLNGVPITVDDVKRAMIEKTGPLYEEAKKRALQEFGVNVMGSITGIPTKAYPPGEENVRAKAEGYQEAWKLYEQGDHDAVNRFLEDNPDYEARIALFKEPEAQLRSFVVDQIWDIYNGHTSLNKREIREQLGDNFVNAVLNKETRSTDSLPVEMLAVWLKAMGGDPPGSLGSEAIPINFAPPDIAQLAQFFYDYRAQEFPNYYELQNEYYMLDEGRARRIYRNVTHPELGKYFEWKWDFLEKNPSVAAYLSENPPTYASPKELQEAFGGEPRISPQEMIATLGAATYNQVVDYLLDGDPLDTFAEDKIEEVTARSGVSEEYIYDLVEQTLQ